MFKDKYGLTQAVLDGRKTMTRRLVPQKVINNSKVYAQLGQRGGNIHDARIEYIVHQSPYKIGEVVAIAQSYRKIEKEIEKEGYPLDLKREKRICAGYTNKMFVRAEDMPHHIKITNIRVEHLQDISDEDCLREGVRLWEDADSEYKSNPLGKLYEIVGRWDGYKSPREAFAALIDKVSGKGTWESNPLVWVYEFELIN